MPNGKLTFTGKVGPGKQLTSQVFDNIKRLEWDFEKQALHFISPIPTDRPISLDYSGVATITVTVSGNVTSITMS